MLTLKNSKKAQVTLFVILAIIIVAVILFLSLFIFKIQKSKTPEVQEAENVFLECVNLKTQEATQLAGSQAGWIYLPKFESGSEFLPFSNYFNFLGNSVPYWFYITGNGIQKTNYPKIEDIEKQLNSWLKQEILDCTPNLISTEVTFSGEPSINSKIKSDSIDLTIFWSMQIKKGNTTSLIEEHKTAVKTNFGNLYRDAKKIFDAENSTMFLEEYSADVLNLYAPTTRVEISCTPKIWQKIQVEQELKDAWSANIPMIKFKGGYYSIQNKENRYFITNTSVNNQINLIYNKNWPTRIEVWPSEGNLLKADPVGTQAGLGIMGFCYIAYHFVYDIDFPVLIQVSKGNEIFQFPVTVIIDKNVPRKAETDETSTAGLDICANKVQTATIFTYTQDSQPLETEIYFKCINQVCDMGKTTMQEGKARLTTKFPECFTGLIIAKNEDYEDARVTVPSNEPFIENIFLEKAYELEVKLDLQVNEKAIINFESPNGKTTLYYPEQNKIKLSTGVYNITAQLFKETNLQFGSQTGEKCVTIPGFVFPFMNKKECFDIQVPQQTLSEVAFGGGSKQISFIQQELKTSRSIEIVPEKFTVPQTIEELADIYSLLEIAELEINLK